MMSGFARLSGANSCIVLEMSAYQLAKSSVCPLTAVNKHI